MWYVRYSRCVIFDKILYMKYKLFLILAAALLLGAGCAPAQQSNQTNVSPEVKSVNNKLDLSNKQLTKAPDYVFNQTDLEELDLSNNQLTGAIQSQIGNLKNLKALRANNNQMTGVPAEIGQLQKLEELDLSNNQLTGLPNELGNLKNLKTLNISGNNYSQADLDGITERLPAGVRIIK